MANTDSPSGFKPTPLLGANPYSADADGATALFIGDLTAVETDGNVVAASAGSDDIVGSNLTYRAASTAETVIVADDPHQRYVAQDDAGGTSSQAVVGTYTDHSAGAGSTTTSISGHEIDGSGYGTTATGVFILDLVGRADNAWGNWAEQRCYLYDHIFGAGSAGV